ncbi:MAG: hypothetical protein Q9209_003071 [Squamulea sp. 1 TL-2023]
MILKTFVGLACISLSIASPFAAPSDSVVKRETYTKEGLAEEFKGLYWNYAFEKDENGNQECTTENLDVLVPALRKTKDFMALLADSDRKDFNSDGAWHTFFIRPNPQGKKIVDQDWNFNDDTKKAFKAINENAKSASNFPFNGGSGSKAQRASIRCREALPDGSKRCDKAKLPAYTTMSGGRGGTGDNTWITFCPLFFKDDIPKLEDLTKKSQKPGDLAHEFMHVDRFTPVGNKHIEDLSDDRVGGLVYGGSRCEDFGWINQKDSPSKVNVKQELNADTYGWWFTAVWFQTKNDWKYDTQSTDRPGWTGTATIAEFDDGTEGVGGVGGDPDDESGGGDETGEQCLADGGKLIPPIYHEPRLIPVEPY